MTTCPACYGTGRIVTLAVYWSRRTVPCLLCKGVGQVREFISRLYCGRVSEEQMDVDTKITVHRFSGDSSPADRPVRISILRGKSNRTIFLSDDDTDRLRGILGEAFRSAKDGFKGELTGS